MKTIPLTNGLEAIIDDADYEMVAAKSWHPLRSHGGFYAKHSFEQGGKIRSVVMHRFIMRPPAGSHVDHINGNTLDNRRSNLRICTQSENARNRPALKSNSTGLKGVFAHPASGRYRAAIAVNKKRQYLGYFDTPEAAARAYDEAARRLHGEFARTNF